MGWCSPDVSPVVVQDSGEEPAREEHVESREEEPENRELIQQLSREAEGSVEVCRRHSDDDEQGPNDMNSGIDKSAIVTEKMH